MALTADQITAQNFKDFYNGIKQYLNASEHRLTSAELDEIMNIAPGANEGLPVLFDETGGERIVGWYKTSQGKKPVYEKTIILNNPTVNARNQIGMNFNTDYTFVYMTGIVYVYDGSVDVTIPKNIDTYENGMAGSYVQFGGDLTSIYINKVGAYTITKVKINLGYTKSADPYQ